MRRGCSVQVSICEKDSILALVGNMLRIIYVCIHIYIYISPLIKLNNVISQKMRILS